MVEFLNLHIFEEIDMKSYERDSRKLTKNELQ